MNKKSVSSDSTFYICFSSDIKKNDCLIKYVNAYSFCIGDRILSEISEILKKSNGLINRLSVIHYDYFELVKPFFGRSDEHKTDGEYEAIGIGNYLEGMGDLAYLILDDGKARKFVKRHFPKLDRKMVGTIGFIRDSCCRDQSINPNDALAILDAIKTRIENENGARPCGMDSAKYKEILMPIQDEIKRWVDLQFGEN